MNEAGAATAPSAVRGHDAAPRWSCTGRGFRRVVAGASIAVLLSAGAAAGPSPGLLQAYEFTVEPFRQWKLPDKLNEISGLAATPDGRLLAVTDEAAIVYELDPEQGRLVKAFALGDPTVRGDFEGIAWLEGRVWLVTSNGLIYESAEGVDGQRVTYEVYRTDVGESCEIEGLAQRRAEGLLLLLCKDLRRGSKLDGLAVFAWSIADHEISGAQTVMLPDRRIVNELRNQRLQPSGITVDERSGNLLIVAARQKALIELAADGTFVSTARLPSGTRHRQSEGIEVLPDGRLLIADEGGGHKARLAIYQPAGWARAGER